MSHIASDKLASLAGLGLILQMEFTYGMIASVYQIISYTLPNILRTLDDVHDMWTRVVRVDRFSNVDLSEQRHQVMRCVGWAVLIEPVDLQVIVFIVCATLESSLRKFHVL